MDSPGFLRFFFFSEDQNHCENRVFSSLFCEFAFSKSLFLLLWRICSSFCLLFRFFCRSGYSGVFFWSSGVFHCICCVVQARFVVSVSFSSVRCFRLPSITGAFFFASDRRPPGKHVERHLCFSIWSQNCNLFHLFSATCPCHTPLHSSICLKTFCCNLHGPKFWLVSRPTVARVACDLPECGEPFKKEKGNASKYKRGKIQTKIKKKKNKNKKIKNK